MSQMEPMLSVDNVDASLAFYRDVLGFEVTFSMPGPGGAAVYGAVRRGDTTIMMGLDPDFPADARPHRGAGVNFYIKMGEGDLDAYYQQVRSRGARVAEEIGDRFWGDRTFTVLDRDGYRLSFYQHVRDVDFSKLSPEEMGMTAAT